VTRRNCSAFSLIEVLVALAIFALMSVLAYQALASSMSNAQALGERMDRLRSIQQAMQFLGRDLVQTAPRPVRNALTEGSRPALLVAPGSDFALEVTHAGWPNPAGLPRGTMQRSAYRIEDGRLVRLHWNALDVPLNSEPVATVLLEDVESLYFRFFLGDGQWSEQWPPTGTGGPAALSLRPRLVEVVLTLPDEGELRRFFEITP
jgi:general secretion pathway protein J